MCQLIPIYFGITLASTFIKYYSVPTLNELSAVRANIEIYFMHFMVSEILMQINPSQWQPVSHELMGLLLFKPK